MSGDSSEEEADVEPVEEDVVSDEDVDESKQAKVSSVSIASSVVPDEDVDESKQAKVSRVSIASSASSASNPPRGKLGSAIKALSAVPLSTVALPINCKASNRDDDEESESESMAPNETTCKTRLDNQ